MAFEHVGDVVDDREAAALFEMGVEMRGVRSQHDPAAPRHHPQRLQAHGVAADEMQPQTGRDLLGTVVEAHAAGEQPPHHAGDVVGHEAVAKVVVDHAAAGAELHLAVLDVECRVRKQVEIAGMVVVHVGDDYVLDLRRIDTEPCEAVGGRAQQFAPAQPCLLGAEAGIDYERAAAAAHRPDEIIERHRRIVRIATEEVLSGTAVVPRIADGVDFVERRFGHGLGSRERRHSTPIVAVGRARRQSANCHRARSIEIAVRP